MKYLISLFLLLTLSASAQKIPVILDTDTGNDIDDTFAIALLVRNPNFDVKLITTTDGRAEHRATLIAKELTIAGRTDIPIGLGAGEKKGEGKLGAWVKGLSLNDYSGKVQRDGVAALIDTINSSPEPITVIAIGPLQTLSEALQRDPSIAAKANLVGMQGSVFLGYGGGKEPAAEFNVKADVQASQRVLSANWRSITITPLDTCGLPLIVLDGDRLTKLRSSNDRLDQAILDAHAIYWGKRDFETTSLMYDCVAIYLADPTGHDLVKYMTLKIKVNDQGKTVVDKDGREMRVAVSWKNIEGFRDYLLNGLLPRR